LYAANAIDPDSGATLQVTEPVRHRSRLLPASLHML
jgi:hypothetical protein